ncbi:uncharacterized protein LOC106012383 [Aplysia californica]|uniref:Uncharacterized protein LOC106012383 n=1 Tax=Aplysia californica TaxID=6500 RepID=A0ABM1A4J1_APLCA|nr:uncharacterized protein LOC106012383 [Aplysia californica]
MMKRRQSWNLLKVKPGQEKELPFLMQYRKYKDTKQALEDHGFYDEHGSHGKTAEEEFGLSQLEEELNTAEMLAKTDTEDETKETSDEEKAEGGKGKVSGKGRFCAVVI